SDVMCSVVQSGERGERSIGRAVVHEDCLPGRADRFERRGELAVEKRDASLLVVHRYHDGDHGARLYAGLAMAELLSPAAALERAEAMAIATGGVEPAGADAVIPIEYVVEPDNRVDIGSAVDQRENFRPRGGHVHAGDFVLPNGARLAAAQICALAAAGRER